ncbi:MAG: sporulation protein YqfD [Oscillospiraceae bacterium]|jgi:similar to stage IV sporulation protein|nr:sporulation protein YqfD [Oscillospiraceae bacterium]
MLSILRYILGFAVFSIDGKNAERFLNLTVRSGINIWKIEKKTGKLFLAKITATNFKNLRNITKKFKVKIKLKSKHGFPFIFNKYKKRLGFLVGPICFVLIIYLLSFFIWNINVVGNKKLTEDEIIKATEELGLRVGTFKNSLDTELLEKNIMLKLADLSWLAVNLQGSSAKIEVKEKEEPPEIVPNEHPCNIISKKPGQITQIQAHTGKAEVKNGDSVAKGDLLINGFDQDNYGKSTINHATGKVFAITKRLLKEKVCFNQILYHNTKKVINRRSVEFFGLKIPLTIVPKPDENYKKELTVNKVRFNNLCLPIVFHKEKCIKQKKEKIMLNIEQAREKAQENLKRREEFEFKNAKILSTNIKERIENGIYYQDVEYTCEEDIAEESEITFEKRPETQSKESNNKKNKSLET